ncbi:MAG TPA: chloride channel protein [Phycisphaerae bacterium]|nr:chloride channel protein [Phycisphaerae bacterium]
MVDQPNPTPPIPPVTVQDSPNTQPAATTSASTLAAVSAAAPPEQTNGSFAKTDDNVRRIGLVYLSFLALAVGIVTGFGAFAFRELIGLIHNIMFLGQFTFHYNSNLFTPESPWGVLVILVPVIGSIPVTFLITKFAPEARGHGVPEVMAAIYYKGGVIRPVVALVKSLASAIALGSGASLGREGPIIQIGSGLGSTLGQIVRMQHGQRNILVAAGAGAGIAATFNTPIGGVLFAIELMMPEVSSRTFLPVALAVGTATFIGRFFFGTQPAFTVPPLAPLSIGATSALTLCLYALLGVVTGVAAALFIHGLHFVEDLFNRIKGPYSRHMLGMMLVGLLFCALQQHFGHYYVEGVGYATIQSILFGQMPMLQLLLLLFVCKLLATSLSLGSGSSGGIFSPSLYMGATIGGAFAAILIALHVPLAINIPSFAMVGMGAMFGGGTGAVLTAVAMIFEMTRDYDIVLPMILAVAFSVGVRRLLSRQSIYTIKLFRRGLVIPEALQANMFLVRRASEVMDSDVILAPAEMNFDAFLSQPEHAGRMRHVIVTDRGRILGVLRVNTALRRASLGMHSSVTLRDVASSDFVLVHANDIVFDIIQEMWHKEAFMALVMRNYGEPQPQDVVGVITKEHVADSVASSINIYPK